MATPAVNLIIEQGEDFSATFSVLEPDETAATLNSYTVFATMKKHPGASTSYTFTTSLVSSQGKITISLNNAVTSTLVPGRYYYDVFTVTSGDIKEKRIEGNIIVQGSASF
jgi:hypothetical protein